MEYLQEVYQSNKEGSIIFLVAVVSLLIQLFYYIIYYLPLARYKSCAISNDLPPVSVVICARNEADNLSVNLPKVLNQDYPNNFEVVIVNDASEDDSEFILAKLKTEHPNLYYTNIPYDSKFKHGKKLALTIGIKAAKYENLVLTDADCIPQSKNWLKQMASSLTQKDIVLGIGAYEKKAGFVNRLLRYDTFMIAVQYLSFAIGKRPYMGVGRNIAYKKEMHHKSNGFTSHAHILSGDDDLFVQDVANKTNVTIQLNSDSQTLSKSPENFRQWSNQKQRHLTTAPMYRLGTKFLLGFELVSRQLFWSSAIVCLFFPIFAIPILCLLILKLVVQLLVLGKIARKIGQKSIVWVGIIFDFILPIILGFLFIGTKRNAKNKRWT